MGRVTLSQGFSIIPEGTHIFKIVGVEYKEQFGKLEIKMKTAKGQTHIERFSLLKSDGSSNEGALKAFSFFARTALQDSSIQDVDPKELVGYFIECDVEHEVVPSRDNPEKTVTFVRLADKRSSDGYEEETKPTTNKTKTKVEELDLDALLG